MVVGEMFVTVDGQMLCSSTVSGPEEAVGGPGFLATSR